MYNTYVHIYTYFYTYKYIPITSTDLHNPPSSVIYVTCTHAHTAHTHKHTLTHTIWPIRTTFPGASQSF